MYGGRERGRRRGRKRGREKNTVKSVFMWEVKFESQASRI